VHCGGDLLLRGSITASAWELFRRTEIQPNRQNVIAVSGGSPSRGFFRVDSRPPISPAPDRLDWGCSAMAASPWRLAQPVRHRCRPTTMAASAVARLPRPARWRSLPCRCPVRTAATRPLAR
jgi:hypothetical protein